LRCLDAVFESAAAWLITPSPKKEPSQEDNPNHKN
jgi:hypothetical protein